MPKNKEKLYNILYKTTNLVNGKVYVGVHCTNNLNDGYIGCGVYSKAYCESYLRDKVKSPFIQAVKKYGYENFKVKIICFFNTEDDTYLAEEKIVDQEWVKNKNNYNVALGGRYAKQLIRLDGLEEEVIADFLNGMTRQQLCKKYGVGMATLRKTLGVREDPPKDPIQYLKTMYEHKFEEYKKLYYQGLGNYKISKILKIDFYAGIKIKKYLQLKPLPKQEYVGVHSKGIFTFTNMTQFCREHGLFNSGIRQCLLGIIPAYKDWRFYKKEDYNEGVIDNDTYKVLKHKGKRFVDTHSNIFTVETTLQAFCDEHGLTPSNIHAIFTGKQKQHKGYRLWQETD